MAMDISDLTASSRSSKDLATTLESRSRPRHNCVMSFDPIDMPSKYSRYLSASRALVGSSHIMMCELPTNALLADKYLEYFDGMSIGSNDMTQLCLGLDRDSSVVAKSFDERDEAVKSLMSMAIKACKAQGKYVGICGRGRSDHPELARWLVDQGIDSLSLNPDTVVETWMFLAGDKQP